MSFYGEFFNLVSIQSKQPKGKWKFFFCIKFNDSSLLFSSFIIHCHRSKHVTLDLRISWFIEKEKLTRDFFLVFSFFRMLGVCFECFLLNFPRIISVCIHFFHVIFWKSFVIICYCSCPIFFYLYYVNLVKYHERVFNSCYSEKFY